MTSLAAVVLARNYTTPAAFCLKRTSPPLPAHSRAHRARAPPRTTACARLRHATVDSYSRQYHPTTRRCHRLDAPYNLFTFSSGHASNRLWAVCRLLVSGLW